MPPAYSTQQNRAISEFGKVTKAVDKSIAVKYLRNHNWDISRAVDSYFTEHTLNQLFDTLRDQPEEYPDTIKIDGSMDYLQQIGVDLEGMGVLVVSELVQSPSFGDIQRDGFITGWNTAGAETTRRNATGVDTLSKQKARVSQILKSLPSDKPLFTRIYKHTFPLARVEGKKALQLDSAVQFWQLLFRSPSSAIQWDSASTPWLDLWIEFLETNWKKDINKDLWEQTLKFAERCVEDESLSWWSEESAWPGVIDEFVEWIRDRRPNGKQGTEDVDME